MKWIKYKVLQNVVDEQEILIEKKIGYSEENLTVAEAEAHNGEYTIEEDEESVKIIPPLGKELEITASTFTTSKGDVIKGVSVKDALDYSILLVQVNLTIDRPFVICVKGDSGAGHGTGVFGGYNVITMLNSSDPTTKWFLRVTGNFFPGSNDVFLADYTSSAPDFSTENNRNSIIKVIGII